MTSTALARPGARAMPVSTAPGKSRLYQTIDRTHLPKAFGIATRVSDEFLWEYLHEAFIAIPEAKRGSLEGTSGYVPAAALWGRTVAEAMKGSFWEEFELDEETIKKLKDEGKRNAQQHFNWGYRLWFAARRDRHNGANTDAATLGSYASGYPINETKEMGAPPPSAPQEAYTAYVRELVREEQRQAALRLQKHSASTKGPAASSGVKRPGSSSTSVPTTSARPRLAPAAPAQRAVATIEDERRMARSDFPVKDPKDVLQKFLESPEPRYIFAPPPSYRDAVRAILMSTRLLSVTRPTSGSLGPEEKFPPPVLKALDRDEEDLRKFVKENNLLNLAPGKSRIDSLNMVYLNSGTYNSIWEVDSNRGGLPPTVEKHLDFLQDPWEKSRLVMRIPTNTATSKDREGWMDSYEVEEEIVNMVDAAMNGIGPEIFAVGLVSKVVADPNGFERDAIKSVSKIVMFVEKATIDVHTRLTLPGARTAFESSVATPEGPPRTLGQTYFREFLNVVWTYSALRALHLDAKLNNFLDSFPVVMNGSKEQGMLMVTDMDAKTFRRQVREVHSDSQSWRPLWLFNVLFVSCFLKQNIDEFLFDTYWWRQVSRPVEVLLKQIQDDDLYEKERSDPAYDDAREFVMQCKWTGHFDVDSEVPPQDHVERDSTSVANQAIKMAKFYFHDTFKDAVRQQYIDRVQTQGSKRPDIKSPDASKARAWFDQIYRPRYLPMLRHFEKRLVDGASPGAEPPLLVSVMHEYCDLSHDDLEKKYNGKEMGMAYIPPSRTHSELNWDLRTLHKKITGYGFAQL